VTIVVPAFSWLVIILVAAAVLALIDGIIRVRGRGAVLAIIEIVLAALLLLSLFVSIPFGSVAVAIALAVVLLLQLILGRGVRRGGLALTLVALILDVLWVLMALGWLVIPGIS
jgi:hypothetical protein